MCCDLAENHVVRIYFMFYTKNSNAAIHFTGIGSLPDDGSLICSPDKSMTSFNISESFDISEGYDISGGFVCNAGVNL